MDNPLSTLIERTWAKSKGLDVRAEASVAVASRHKQPMSVGASLFTRANAGAQLQTTRTSGTVHSITHRISSDVARQDWVLRPTGATETDSPAITVHPFLDLWDRPNETMTPTGRAFRQLCGLYLELLGEACILVETVGGRGQGQPVELWPLRPDRLTPVPDPHNWLAGWIYTDEDGQTSPLLPEQVIQLKYPDPVDPYRGLSPLVSAMTEVESTEFANDWQRNYFLNSALPAGVVTTDEEMTAPEFAEWVERWNEQHRGPNSAGRTAMMDRGGKFIQTTMSMVDMQLTELITANRGGIREAWGLSKTLLGQTEDVNRATAEAAQYIYGRYTLADRVDLWKEAGNEILRRYPSVAARPGQRSRLEVDIAAPLASEDVVTAAKERDSLVKAWIQLVDRGADPAATAEALSLPAVPFPTSDDGAEVVELGAKEMVELLQKAYLAVGVVLERNELRAFLRDVGWDSYLTEPDTVEEEPEPDPPPVLMPPPFGAPAELDPGDPDADDPDADDPDADPAGDPSE